MEPMVARTSQSGMMQARIDEEGACCGRASMSLYKRHSLQTSHRPCATSDCTPRRASAITQG